ncbi:hypothetical protein NUU61_006707 [Penicillium alfredii]|uniref:Uncharacterized protein n=1 Tax=Penicillium alfredii TaxID=1506179 RepID=A0A9W9F1G7_9EURO|nr:uncharacterized protein NUU61_006707 [Penicillium alfredii]KAJ5091837.1 hypothetical protein NUU61_006707 [Penicillium alfredii]
MVELGKMAAVFLAAGNQNPLQEDRIDDMGVVSTYPQLFHNQVAGMTLVGMATQKGIQSKLSKMVPRNGLWAIGDRVKCASTKRRGWDWKVGTSFASPLAAGLAADEMALLLRSYPEYSERFPDEAETRRFLDDVLETMFRKPWIRPGGVC